MSSHPSRGRGLKQHTRNSGTANLQVAPFTGAWIETPFSTYTSGGNPTSHPSRGRGLKHRGEECNNSQPTSHPLRVRGLKPSYPREYGLEQKVAPFTGAWIETCKFAVSMIKTVCRTLCGSGIQNVVRNVTGCLFSSGLMTDICHDFPPTPNRKLHHGKQLPVPGRKIRTTRRHLLHMSPHFRICRRWP